MLTKDIKCDALDQGMLILYFLHPDSNLLINVIYDG